MEEKESMMPPHTQSEVIALGNFGDFGPIWIRSAAVLIDGEIFEGARHHLILRDIFEKYGPKAGKNQGFVDNFGRYLTRSQAAKLALENGQIIEKQYNKRDLFSEELWKL